MSILAKYNAAMEAKNETAMKELLHDDYKFTMHASGKVLGKADVIKWAMSGDIKRDKIRVLFENDEIGIEHALVTFDDGNTEAVMAVFKYQDGKMISLETGATKIPK
jgi:1-deoxy-D-xylulose 5-phosphate reductoisomerase